MEEIYEKYYDKLFKWAINKTNNKEDTEDLVNNVFLAIFTYLNRNINIDKLDNLIWKIAHNLWNTLAIKYIKEKDNISYDNTYDISSNDNTIEKIIYKEIINNLGNIGLTPKEEQAFRLYYIYDMSINDISIKLDTSNSNIKYYLYSARNKIKEKYNGKD